MGTKIRDYKGELIECIEKLDKLNKKILLDEHWAEDKQEIQIKVDKTEPSLMFYGIYNAGKSSLLNAIFGEKKASVADVPETHSVTNYRWNHYDLVDTPGINGPEKDFRISRAELDKHHVIMFVIDDSDTFDSDFVATEIVNIIEAKKPLIIVLNNKQDSDTKKFETIRYKLYENISKAGVLRGIQHIEQKYSFIVVNANMAYKGKEQNKEVLLKMSKIQDLEILITQALRHINEVKILKLPAQMLLQKVNSYNELIKKEMGENEEKYFLTLLQRLEDHKNIAVQQMGIEIRRQVRQYNELIYTAVIAGKEIECLQQEMVDKINRSLKMQMETFTKYCQQEVTVLLEQPELKIQLSNKNDEDYLMEDEVGSFKTVVIQEDNMFKDIVEAALLGMKIPPVILPLPVPPIPVPVVIAVVKGIINLFKSNQSENRKSLEEMQQRAERLNAQEKKNITQRINAMQEARTQVTLQLHQFEEQALKLSNDNIVQAYKQVKQDVEKLMTLAGEKLEEYQSICESVGQVQMKLNALINELD